MARCGRRNKRDWEAWSDIGKRGVIESPIETLILEGDRVAVVDRAQPTPYLDIDGFAEEGHVAVAEQGGDAAGVPAAGGAIMEGLGAGDNGARQLELGHRNALAGIHRVRIAGVG